MATARDPDLLINTYRRLADGAVCRIRPSQPDDRDLVEACFNELSPQSWHQRFFSAKHALTSADLDRLCDIDGRDHIAFAAVRIDETGRELEALGFARCLRLGAGSDQGELAVTVVDRCQRQGLGTALLNRLVPAARAQGIESMRCEVLTTNSGMRRLAQHLGGHVLWSESGTMEYDCPLPAPAPAPIPVNQAADAVPAAAPGFIPALTGGQAPIRVPGPLSSPSSAPAPASIPNRPPPATAHPGGGLPWFLSPTAWLDAWLAFEAAPWRESWPAPMLDPSIAPWLRPLPDQVSGRTPEQQSASATAPQATSRPTPHPNSDTETNATITPWWCRLPDPQPASAVLPAIAEGAGLWWRLFDDCVAAARIGIDALSSVQPPLGRPTA